MRLLTFILVAHWYSFYTLIIMFIKSNAKQTKNIPFILAIGVLALTSACTKKGNTGATGPAGPAYTGAISGHVDLYDQYGNKVLSGLSNASLQLNGGTAITPNATGYYLFGNLMTGDYDITTTCIGYAATKTNNFQFLSDTLNKDIKLSAIPAFSPTSMTVYTALASPGDSLVINFTADTQPRNCILFINSNTTAGNLPVNYVLAVTKAIPANQTKVAIVISATDLYAAGFSSGITFYCAAYGYVVGDVSVYEDLSTGKNVYNAVGASPVTTTAIVP